MIFPLSVSGFDADGAAALCGIREVGGTTIAQKIIELMHEDLLRPDEVAG